MATLSMVLHGAFKLIRPVLGKINLITMMHRDRGGGKQKDRMIKISLDKLNILG